MPEATGGPPGDSLRFRLPDFTRHSWISDGARRTWEPRLDRIRSAWLDVEWLSIAAEVRRCALVGLTQDALAAAIPRWSARRLSALGLPMTPETHPGMVFAAVGSLDDVNRARDAWVARDDEGLGRLLGYPDCCRAFFRDVWVRDRCIDTTWAMAANTAAPRDAVVTLDASDTNLANILWRWLGVRAVPHLPCRFDCGATIELGERLLRVGEAAGHRDEVAWIRDMLSWPIEWSGLHGIAEVKTPILKISTRTDATASKYVVRWTGTGYPPEGATGLGFPYRAPARPLMTDGRRYQLGLRRPIEAPATEPSWFHLDNGFASLEAMTRLHRPIVELARRALHGSAGDVLDLGCGNGALLATICAGRSDLVPRGVDRSSAALEHARTLLPDHAASFTDGDLFDGDTWRGGPRYALAIVMAGRLLEVERPIADRLLQRLHERADAVLVYAYPGPGTRSLGSIAGELGLRLTDHGGDTAAMLATSASPRDDLDWGRLAEPQADQYDIDAILGLVSSTTSADRPHRYRRTPVGESPSIFDGQVAIRHVYRSVPDFASLSARYPDGPAAHPNLDAAAEHIRSWPLAFTQCQRLLEAIHPAADPGFPLESAELYRGSSCHSFESHFGTMWATIYCPYGLAEAIVHELAHQKLRALGVSFESSTAIVGNDPDARYVSHIVKDRLRPMTAVLHAQYSYVHVTALDVAMVRAARDPARRAVLGRVLARNLARIEEGHATLAERFRPGRHGRAFMDGLDGWTGAVIASAQDLLRDQNR